MKRFLRWGLAAVGAGAGLYLVSAYLVRPEDVDKATAGPLRFIPGSSGFGLDDVAQGAGALLGAAAGNFVGRLVLGKG